MVLGFLWPCYFSAVSSVLFDEPRRDHYEVWENTHRCVVSVSQVCRSVVSLSRTDLMYRKIYGVIYI